jgi:hypothetical protein
VLIAGGIGSTVMIEGKLQAGLTFWIDGLHVSTHRSCCEALAIAPA